MGSYRAIILLAICTFVLVQCVSSSHHSRKHHDHNKREIAAVKRATFNVTLDGGDSTETTTDILTRLKLLAYAEKLKAKQAKKKAKADKKAQKEAAWAAYLNSLVPATAAPGTAPGVGGAAAPAAAPLPGVGLWKKSFLLSQLAMANAAAAQAQAQAAAAAQSTTPVPSGVAAPAPTSSEDSGDFEEDE